MLSKDVILLLLKETYKNSNMMSIANVLCETDNCTFYYLNRKVKGKMNPTDLQQTLILMMKKDLINITGKWIELNTDTLLFLFYKPIMLNFVIDNYNELKNRLIVYLYQNINSTFSQTVKDISRWFKAENLSYSQDQIKASLEELIKEGLIIYTQIGMKVIKLNTIKLYSRIRADFCYEFLKEEDKRTAELIRLILQNSSLNNKACFVKKTEKITLEQLKEFCLFQLPDFTKIETLESTLQRIRNEYIKYDVSENSIVVDIEKLIEMMKIEVIESYILNLFDKQHLRLLRGLVLMTFKTEKELEEYLLVKRTDYRKALLDLEKQGLVVRVESKGEIVFPYRPNLSEFSNTLLQKYSKIVGNLLIVNKKLEKEGGDFQETQEMKIRESMFIMFRRMLILNQF